MDKTEEVFLMLLICGNNLPYEQQIYMFSELADLSDLSDENDFVDVGINYTTMFVEKGLEFFKHEQYDEFIEYFKEELIKKDKFELINYLKL